MAEFNCKSFNPQAFGAYVKRIPNVKKNELSRCGAVGSSAAARKALSAQSGSLYARIPYFGRIDGSTSQNNDGATDIESNTTTTYEQGFVTASRMDAWTERSFSSNISAGVNFMDNVAAQIAEYKLDVKQRMLLAILKGVFSMNTDGNTVAAKAAAEFLDKHIYDISGKAGEEALVNVDTLNKAIQKACGDNKSLFKLAIMNSAVAARLENLKLIRFMSQTDENGIERDLEMGTWNGRLVLVDDNMPVEETDGGELVYTTYVLGEGSVILDNIGDSVPYEMSRDPKTNGGQDTLYVRDRYICGVNGLSFEKPAEITASAKNSDLANGANWQIINDGKTAVPHKSIAICKIISKG